MTDHVIGSNLALRIVTGGDPDDSALFTADWAIPINTYGTNVVFDYLHSNYGVGEALVELGMTGRTEMYGAKIAHPIFKKKNMNLQFSFGYRNKYNKNIILDATRSIDELKQLYVFFNFDNLDRFLGKNIVSLGYTWGAMDFDKTVSPSRLGADRGFDKYSFNVARIQKIYGYTNIMLRAAAQYSDKRLVPMEQVGLGGYGTVRGYKPSLLLGDSGYNFSAELMFAPPLIAEKSLFGQRIAQLLQFAVFWDHGQVYTTDFDADLDDYDSRFLSGYGFGVRLFYKDRFTLKYDLGVPKDRFEDEPKHYHYVQGSWKLF
jgi:hemolysin activation/secretion protein